MQKSFNIKGRQINCEIVRSQRRTVAIQIHPDRRIELKVPLLYNINEVDPFLLKHHRWIFKRLDAPVAPKTEPKRFVDGELHYFLGKQYPIKIIISPENTVVFQDDTIVIYAKYDLPDLIEVLLEKWYFTQARAVFQKISILILNIIYFFRSFVLKLLRDMLYHHICQVYFMFVVWYNADNEI